MSTSLVRNIKRERDCKLSGDLKHDSLGHNAKYVTYSLINQRTNEIFAFAVMQITEASNSNRMGKLSFTKALNEYKKKQICVNRLTSDRHTRIRIYMREEESKITHQFDTWYLVKNIKKRLHQLSKNKSSENLQK